MRFNKIKRNILKTMEHHLTFYKEGRQIMLKSRKTSLEESLALYSSIAVELYAAGR